MYNKNLETLLNGYTQFPTSESEETIDKSPQLTLNSSNTYGDPIKIIDNREKNPTTGEKISTPGKNVLSVDSDILKAIIAHAKAKGVDPYTALAIAYQETKFGKADPNYGSAWSYSADDNIPKDTVNQNANILAKALADKLKYAANLQKLKKIKEGEDYLLQGYNGYGDLRHALIREGDKYLPGKFYGITIKGDQPYKLSDNPLYGKTIISLRDELFKKQPEIQKIVEKTKAYK